MRMIHRKAVLIVAAFALVASMSLAPAVAGAATKRATPIKKLSKRVHTLSVRLNVIAKNLKNVTATVNQGIPIITQLVSGLQTVGAGLKTAAAGLTTLSAAVSDPTTGLPGLNGARSLIGAVVSNAATSGSEFSATRTGPGTYVLSFKDGAGNAADVSKRVIMVTPFPTGGAPVIASAVSCAAASNPCTSADTKATDALVLVQATSAAPTDANFQVAAISG